MPHTITEHLDAWNQGDRTALERLTPFVYQELRAIARRALAGEQSGTLYPTELVHEYFLRVQRAHSPNWRDRAHFYGAAAVQMRRVLVDLARRRKAAKRLKPVQVELDARTMDLELLDDALRRLAELDARQARLVELRFFGGLNIEETAGILNISPATVKREWTSAKAWLLHQLRS